MGVWCLGMLLLTGLPYLLGACLTTPDSVFSGFFVAVEDGNHYLAVMRQGAAGRWAFNVPFTPEAHPPGYVYVFYLALGRLAHIVGLPLPLALHLAKIVTTPFLLAAVYRFTAHFTGWRIMRQLAFFLIAAGGGLGWLWVLAGGPFAPGAMPTDLWVPDASTFLTMLTFPHLAIAQALILWIAVCGLQLLRTPGWRRAILIGVLGLLLSLVHPYSLPLVFGLLGLCWTANALRTRRVEWHSLAQLLVAGLFAAPYLVYSVDLFSNEPVFRSWQEQARTWSPNVIHYLLGFGLSCPLAAIGLLSRHSVRRWPDHTLPVLWLVLVPLGLYLPSNLQRRFLDGYQVPLTLVAVAGLFSALYYLPRRWRSRATVAVGALSTLSNVLLLLGFVVIVAGRPATVFNQRAVLDAIDWLDVHAPPDSVVLAAYDTGNLLPARAVVRSFVGHGPESVQAEAKKAQVKAFFGDTMTDEERIALLETYQVGYVFHGPSERALGTFTPARLPNLRPVYANQQVSVYHVGLDAAP